MNRHMLLMILCCAIPLGLIFLLPYVGVTLSSGVLLLCIVLLCPLMHLLMMGKHGHGSQPHEEHESQVEHVTSTGDTRNTRANVRPLEREIKKRGEIKINHL